jgi:hypothetical protein
MCGRDAPVLREVHDAAAISVSGVDDQRGSWDPQEMLA